METDMETQLFAKLIQLERDLDEASDIINELRNSVEFLMVENSNLETIIRDIAVDVLRDANVRIDV